MINPLSGISKLRMTLPGLLLLSLLTSCSFWQDDDQAIDNYRFSVDDDFILMNDEPLIIRGIVYVPGYPGYLPWELEEAEELPEQLVVSINGDVAEIRDMGANVIRLWGTVRDVYLAIMAAGDLSFIQTISIDSHYPDYQNSIFKENVKTAIRRVVDSIYSVYTDHDPPLIAYLIGNELSSESIQATDAAHPDITSFAGDYITANHLTATEVFLAEMADYLKTYENEQYGNVSLVSYANYLYTADIIDTPFLDFRCHNIYSYDLPAIVPDTPPGSSSGTLLQGWVEELKARYHWLPLLVTETGLSVSPNAIHFGPPHYGYGGNTEEDQATGLVQNIIDINTTLLPSAGVCIHEYLDAWWKWGLEDSYSHDPDDVEEWFGITQLMQSGNWYITEPRPAYGAIQQIWGE